MPFSFVGHFSRNQPQLSPLRHLLEAQGVWVISGSDLVWPSCWWPKDFVCLLGFLHNLCKRNKKKKLEVSARGESGEGGSNGFDWLVVSGYLGILIGKGVDTGVSMNEGQMDGER